MSMNYRSSFLTNQTFGITTSRPLNLLFDSHGTSLVENCPWSQSKSHIPVYVLRSPLNVLLGSIRQTATTTTTTSSSPLR
jgi:hypothetical protein